MEVSERISFCAKEKKQILHLILKLLQERMMRVTPLNTTRLTFKFSGQNWWPYMSMADRKMDSTWLCLSSYDGKWDAIKTYGTFTNILYKVHIDGIT